MVSAGYSRQRDGVAEYRKRKKTKTPYLEGFGGRKRWFQKLVVNRSQLETESESFM